MEVGHRWRIGNGDKVRVWKDCRVPGLEDSKIKSQVRIIDQNVLVCDLKSDNEHSPHIQNAQRHDLT